MAILLIVRIWLVILFLYVTPLALAQQEADTIATEAVPADGPIVDEDSVPDNWVDATHTVAADSAQAAVEWMDNFFGDPNYDLDKAESYLRLEFENDWDQDDGNDFGVRLRGKVQLPKISQRVNLLFADEDSDLADRDEREDSDNIALQYVLRDRDRARFDATLGWASGNLKPGVRYRNEGPLGEGRQYRYVQRIQYEDDEKFFTLGQVDLYKAFNSRDVMRWSNRIKYGERTEGVEWRTRLSMFQRWWEDSERPLAVNYFATVSGETRPKSFTKNYRLGTVVRRQVYRDFLFFEVEPAINYRREEYDDQRDVAWSIMVRLEIALSRNLREDEDD